MAEITMRLWSSVSGKEETGWHMEIAAMDFR